jgi:N-succinyldiaminopimelate aminotransferase
MSRIANINSIGRSHYGGLAAHTARLRLFTCESDGARDALEEWQALFALSDRYGFVIAADECYSEIHFDEAHPPLGALQAARRLGRDGFPRLIVFSSLSKRSNVPGMRSGFVAGMRNCSADSCSTARIKGCAMSRPCRPRASSPGRMKPTWSKTASLSREVRYCAVHSRAGAGCLEAAGRFLSVGANAVPTLNSHASSTNRRTFRFCREAISGVKHTASNPGSNRVRIALVASTDECAEAPGEFALSWSRFRADWRG